jgi:predicted Fe-Mo cluster-binding NifX family protein
METLKVAVPLAEGRLTNHFGHCASFAVLVADKAAGKAQSREDIVPPPHEPGLLPRWLGEMGVNLIIAGGMGSRARDLFNERGITVVTGAPCLTPEELVAQYLGGTLQTGENGCDH